MLKQKNHEAFTPTKAKYYAYELPNITYIVADSDDEKKILFLGCLH